MRITVEPTACSHIRFIDSTGAVVAVYTFEELQQPVQRVEDSLLVRLKYAVTDLVAMGSAKTVQNMKRFVERIDF